VQGGPRLGAFLFRGLDPLRKVVVADPELAQFLQRLGLVVRAAVVDRRLGPRELRVDTGELCLEVLDIGVGRHAGLPAVLLAAFILSPDKVWLL